MKSQFLTSVVFLAPAVFSQAVIDSGTGFGTYYYDVEQVEACGTSFANQNLGFVECNLLTGLSLNDIDSNYIVAMNHTQIADNLAEYCGKRVVVTANGVKSDLPLFIGDGCQRCGTGSRTNTAWDPNGAPGLDFSYTVLSELNSNACFAGHIDISWEIVDETLYDFDTNAPGQPTGPVNQRRSVSQRSERATRRHR